MAQRAIASLEGTILVTTKHMRGVRIDPARAARACVPAPCGRT